MSEGKSMAEEALDNQTQPAEGNDPAVVKFGGLIEHLEKAPGSDRKLDRLIVMRRFSADNLDSGYRNYSIAMANGKTVHVFLDGIEQHYVITADEEAGFIVRCIPDANGAIQPDAIDPERILTERLTGQVVIEVRS